MFQVVKECAISSSFNLTGLQFPQSFSVLQVRLGMLGTCTTYPTVWIITTATTLYIGIISIHEKRQEQNYKKTSLAKTVYGMLFDIG